MSKREHQFNEVVRKVRKDLFGKGPDSIKTVFVDNMAITTLKGNLTPVEKFIIQSSEGFEQVHRARTKMIQDHYKKEPPVELEEVMQSKLVLLFSDINIEEDIAVSVFMFEQPIER
ncbi:DUF2294 domain-containing protein [Neobacillus terrae]|uniref:DUF2294 domain-containing protein n=1 Tax=Neobacillus terrae TaxID=3034837 RepID=UPI00140BB041|nr:DUF2294 domain-containing protein [Neobacillus terrae]NHM31874.1 DUF2294 domain-containing protein [Neobacillus terrae]